jgi:hypothetical protein
MVSVVDCFVHFALACATITFMAQIKSRTLAAAMICWRQTIAIHG